MLAVSTDQEKPAAELLQICNQLCFTCFPQNCCVCIVSMATVVHHGDLSTPREQFISTGCGRGRAAGTSAPSANPKCKCKGNARTVQPSDSRFAAQALSLLFLYLDVWVCVLLPFSPCLISIKGLSSNWYRKELPSSCVQYDKHQRQLV